MAFHCGQCNEDHEGLPDVGYDHPDPYFAVPKEKRAERTTFTLDCCTAIDEEGDDHYFIRGVLDIPVHGQEPFGIGVWVSQSKANYEKYLEHDDEDDDLEPTYGYLVNRIELYEDDTFLLKARVLFRGGGQRPCFELEPTNHPLAVDQRNGISIERAWQMVHRCMN